MLTLRQRIRTLRESTRTSLPRKNENKSDSLRKRVKRMTTVVSNKIARSENGIDVAIFSSAISVLNQAMMHVDNGDDNLATKLINSAKKLIHKAK